MISPSLPEPSIDVSAQIAALLSPEHPKTAVWLATGTPVPDTAAGIIIIRHAAGTLLTTDQHKAQLFEQHPSDNSLAHILDYIEPKSTVSGVPIVVQARNAGGGVVTEMVCSPALASHAADRAGNWGEVSVLSMQEALVRRIRLWLGGF